MNDPVSTPPDLSEEETRQLVDAIERAEDTYAKMDAMEPYVDWGQRRRLLWELTRSRELKTCRQPQLWDELANGLAWASGEDVVALLTCVESYDQGNFESRRLIDDWPISLDRLVCRAYAEDPEPFHEAWDQFPDPVKTGLRMVFRRFGALERDEIPEDIVRRLAAQHIKGGGLPMRVPIVASGEVVEVELYGHEGPKPDLYNFVELFGEQEEWSRAVLEETLDAEYPPSFGRTYDAWAVASTGELEALLRSVDIQKTARPNVYRILLEERGDSPEALLEMARDLDDEGLPPVATEICVVTAILKWKERGEPVPGGVEDLLTFRSLGKPAHRSEYRGLRRLLEALEAIPKARVVRRMETLLAGEFTRTDAFPVLQVAADDEELVERAFEAAEAAATGERASFAAMHPVANGLAMAADEIFDRLVEAFDAADDALLRDTYHRAIVYHLSERSKRGDVLEPSLDRFLSFVDWESEWTDDYRFGQYILPDLEIVFANLHVDRAESLLGEQINSGSEHWPRALEAVAHHPTDALLREVFARISNERVPPAGGSFNWLERFFQGLEEPQLAKLGAVLAESDSAEFHNVARESLGDAAYRELLEEYGGESKADETPGEKIRRLSDQLRDRHPQLATAPVYFLHRVDEPADGNLNRIGGPPTGLDADDWPFREGAADAPMEHMLTLDLETTPAIRERAPDGARTVSLFVHDPDFNEAWNPYSADAKVVFATDEEVDRGPFDGELPAGEEETGVGFGVTEVDIPLEVFREPETIGGEELGISIEELRHAVFESPAYAGGSPIWLQADESPSDNFIMQFDEQFVPMNLGDMGVMYVFAETAFWQCH